MNEKKPFDVFWKALCGFLAMSVQRNKYSFITPEELLELINSGEKITIVDYRYESDHKKGHIKGAMSIPFNYLNRDIKQIPKEYPIVSVCYVGMVARVAAQTLAKKGCGSSKVLLGGIKAWERTGYPVVDND